jgi:hypothetical protein
MAVDQFGLPILPKKKKKKQTEASAPTPSASGLPGLPAPASSPVSTGPQRGVEGYVPPPAPKAAFIDPVERERIESQIGGPLDRTLANLIYAHKQVFGSYPDFSLTSDLLGSGEVEFETPEEAVQFFELVKKNYTGKNDWMLDPSQDTFGEGTMKRAAGVEGFSAETDILDPEMIASFRPKSVNDFLLGPYMKHTVDGEQSMFRTGRMRLDELTIALPKQWAISQLGDALTARGRRMNPDLAEDEALMTQLNRYIAERVPTDMAPQVNARWQENTENGLRMVQMMRAAALYMAKDGEDDEAAAFLATNGYRQLMTTLEQQIRLPADPTGKTDEAKRAWITEWFVNSRGPRQTEAQALHELYDMNPDALTIEGQQSVGADHVGAIMGVFSSIKDGVRWVAEEALELDTIYDSDEFRGMVKAVAPYTGAMAKVLGVTVGAPLTVGMEALEEYGKWVYGAVSATQRASGAVPNLLQAVAGPLWGNPGVEFGEFVSALHGDSDGDIEWFGDWLEQYRIARDNYENGQTDDIGFAAMESWGLHPHAHPEIAFLWAFGAQTGVDLVLAKGAGAVHRVAKFTTPYRRATSLGKTKFVERTVGGLVAKWINENPNLAPAHMTRVFGLEPETARELVAKALDVDPQAEAFYTRKPVSNTKVIELLDESVRVKGRRLDPYAWGFRPAIRDAIAFSHGKWYSPDRNPKLQYFMGRSWRRDAVAITHDRQEQALDLIDYTHRHILNNADRYNPTDASEFKTVQQKLEARLQAQLNKNPDVRKNPAAQRYYRSLIREVRELETITDIGLWRSSLYQRSQQLALERLRALDPKAAAGLTEDGIRRITMAYRGAILLEMDNDVSDMLGKLPAQEGWLQRTGLRKGNVEMAQQFAINTDEGVFYPLSYQHQHWMKGQIRKAARSEEKPEKAEAYVSAQGGKKAEEISKAFNPEKVDEFLAAADEEIDYFVNLVHEMGLLDPETMRAIQRAREEIVLPGKEAAVAKYADEAEEALVAQATTGLDEAAAAAAEEVTRRRLQATLAATNTVMREVQDQVEGTFDEIIENADELARRGQAVDQAVVDLDDAALELVHTEPRYVVRRTRAELELQGNLASLQHAIDAVDLHLHNLTKALQHRGFIAGGKESDWQFLQRVQNEIGEELNRFAQTPSRLLRPEDLERRNELLQLEALLERPYKQGGKPALTQRAELADRIHSRRAEIEGQLRLQELADSGLLASDEIAAQLDTRLKARFGEHAAKYEVKLGEGEFDRLVPREEIRAKFARKIESGKATPHYAARMMLNYWDRVLSKDAKVKEQLNLLAERLMNGEVQTIVLPKNLGWGKELENGLQEILAAHVDKIIREQSMLQDSMFGLKIVDNELVGELQGKLPTGMGLRAAAEAGEEAADSGLRMPPIGPDDVSPFDDAAMSWSDVVEYVENGGTPSGFKGYGGVSYEQVRAAFVTQLDENPTRARLLREQIDAEWDPDDLATEMWNDLLEEAGWPRASAYEVQQAAEYAEAGLTMPPYTRDMRQVQRRIEANDARFTELTDEVSDEEALRWWMDRESAPEEIRELFEEREALWQRFDELSESWMRNNQIDISEQRTFLERANQRLAQQFDETEEPLQRLQVQEELERNERMLNNISAMQGEIDDIFSEIEVDGKVFTAGDLPLLRRLSGEAFSRHRAAQLQLEAARAAHTAAWSNAKALAQRVRIHLQRLENLRAKVNGGTVWDDEGWTERLRTETMVLDPSTPAPERIEHVYEHIKHLRNMVERWHGDPAGWFDWEWTNREGKTFLLELEPQPGVDWQLKQFHYPRYNYNKLAKFMYGGPVRAAEYLNARKLFGYASLDDATSLYKTLVLAKISTLIRIPMADEMTRFIPEGINPLKARDARDWMIDYDKMPDDVKADIASLMENLAEGDSSFVHWNTPLFNKFLLKQAMDDRRSPAFAYFMSGRLRGVEGMRQAVREWMQGNQHSSLYKHVEQALANPEHPSIQVLTRNGLEETDDGVLIAYQLIGMERGGGLHNLSFETHRLTREGKATSQVLDMARMLESKFDYWTKHPAFGHFYALGNLDELDLDEVIKLASRGKWHQKARLGANVTVDHTGKAVQLSGHLSAKEMRKASAYLEDLIKANLDQPEKVDYLMPWAVGRERHLDIGGIPVVKNIQRFTYSLLDKFASTMNEMMYATAFKAELAELQRIHGTTMKLERLEELAHFSARQYVYDVMFNGSIYFGEDALRNLFLFLPAYRQFMEYWLPQMIKKPTTVGSFVYRVNTAETREGGSGFGWVRPLIYPDLQINLASASFLINQGDNGVFGWLPGGGPILTMPLGLMATLNADDPTSIWGELPRHWPFTFSAPFRSLNSPMDKVVYGITGRRLPWPFGTDPDRDPWRELMATRTDALEGKWPNEPKHYNVQMRLRALFEGGWNYVVPYQMRFSDRDVERMVMSRKAYSQAQTPEEVEKILSEPGNEVFKQFVEWQNLPSYLQFDYLQKHPKIIPFMISGFDSGSNAGAGRAILWSKLRTFTGVADPTAYHERLGYRYGQLKSVVNAIEARAERDEEVKWWERYRRRHKDDHNIYRLTEEWEKSEGAFEPGGHFYQQGRRGLKFYQDDINLKWAGIDDSFNGITSYDADSFRFAALMDDMGGASKALLQLSPNYEMYVLRKVQKGRDATRDIAKRFLDVRQPTRLTPSDIAAAGYTQAEAKQLAEAVNFIDRLWDEANKRIKPLGKYGYATSEGREIRKRAIIAQNRLLHSSPLLEQFLGQGAVSLFRSTYLTKPVWEREDFINLDEMDPVERETFYRLLTRKDPATGKRMLKNVPYLPDGSVRVKELPRGKVLGYVPVVKNGKVVGWKTRVKVGQVTGLVSGKRPRGVDGFEATIGEAIKLMQVDFERAPSDVQALLAWRKRVRDTLPRWAQDLAYDWVRAEAWKHYFDAAASARRNMRDTVNPWYSDTPGFSSQSKYGMKLKKWLLGYSKYLQQLSPEFGTEYRSYNDDNMLTNAILGWYL